MGIKKTKSGVSDSLKRISRSFYNDSFSIIGDGVTDTVLEAKKKHRFKRKSGNLERSILSKMNRSTENIRGKVWLEPGIANYGKYIHTLGHGSWKADPFLKRASKNHFPKINRKIIENLKKLIG